MPVPPTSEPPYSDFAPLVDSTPARCSVAEAILDEELLPPAAGSEALSTRLVGTLVHRLLQREGLRDQPGEAWAFERLATLLRTDEASAVDDCERLCARAASAYRAFVANTEVRAIYRSGQPLHEVPFSVAVDGRIVHGAIDCLVRGERSVTVLEFKTGRPRPEHQAQLALYRRAAAALFPGAAIEARLVYGEEVHS